MSFKDKVAMVAGGSAGIGQAIAAGLAARGARVAIVTRGAQQGEALAGQLRAAGGEAAWFQGDFLDYASMQAAAAAVRAALGPVNILIVTGGPDRPRPKLFMDTDPADYTAMFNNKCANRLIALRAVADQMIEQGKGKVVFLTTDAGRVPTPGESLVGTGAAGLIFATRAVARELSRHGIRINTVSATLTKNTSAWNKFLRGVETGSNEALVKAFRKIESRSPFGLNEPEDVANLALFLAADESDQISGATMSVNGGLSFP